MGTIQPGTNKIGSTSSEGRAKYARFFYDFAAQGGAISSITMTGDAIPSGAIVIDALIHVDTALTSGGAATVALQLESAADVNAVDAVSGAPWSTTGAKRADFTSTTAPIKTTAARSLLAVVATATVTAGKFSVVLTYVELA